MRERIAPALPAHGRTGSAKYTEKARGISHFFRCVATKRDCPTPRTADPACIRVTRMLRFPHTNCFAAMLDSNATCGVKREARYFRRRSMKPLISSSSLIIALLWTAVLPTNAQQVNVTQEHNNPSRDGLYIDSAFTPSNAAKLTRDLNFD